MGSIYDEEVKIFSKIAALAIAAICAGNALAATIPIAQGTTLDGHAVILPRDLSPQTTVLILGFTRQSQESTTAWQKAVQIKLADAAYFDIPFLEDAPGFIRPMILRGIRKQVPEMLRSRFLPLTAGQREWKQTVGYTQMASDAAYVLVVDRNGKILWQTHDAFSDALFEQMAHIAKPINTHRD